MVYTIPYAFTLFQQNTVDLDPKVTKTARNSRDYLCEQLSELQNKVAGFPKLGISCIPFGSFSRRTKTRPLNDVDLLLPLNGRGTQEQQGSTDAYKYWVYVTDDTAPLAAFIGSPGYVDSNKILFKIRDSLSKVPNYYAAAAKKKIRKKQNAVTLDLLSYDWVFDIVPALPVGDNQGQTTHYLIPDGDGDWIRTDPRRDQTNITAANSEHHGLLIPTVRLLKYWNTHGSQPRLESYYFETLVLKVFEFAPEIKDYPHAVEYFFRNHSTALWLSCPDPKDLGPNLDADVLGADKLKIAGAMKAAAGYARQALAAQAADNAKEAFSCWQRVFGSEFPKYGN